MRMPSTVFLNSSLSCPHFCPSIARFAGICSFCLAAQDTAAIPQSGLAQRLPISMVAQLHLLNSSLGGQQDVLRTFQLLEGQDWTTFLLAYLEAFGTDSISSSASHCITSLLLCIIITLFSRHIFIRRSL